MKRHALKLLLVVATFTIYASEHQLCPSRLSLEVAKKLSTEEREKHLATYQKQLVRVGVAGSQSPEIPISRNTLQWNVIIIQAAEQLQPSS